MNRQPLRRHARDRVVYMAAIVILAGLALVVARASSRQMRHAGDDTPLFPGFTVYEMPGPKHKLIVTSLQSGSEAQMNGIMVGDEVLAIDNQPAGTLDETEVNLRDVHKDKIVLRLRHDATQRSVALSYRGSGQHGS